MDLNFGTYALDSDFHVVLITCPVPIQFRFKYLGSTPCQLFLWVVSVLRHRSEKIISYD